MAVYNVITFSHGLKKLPKLAAFLAAECVYQPKRFLNKKPADSSQSLVVGWGNKPNTARAIRYAKQNHHPYLQLEDGFLRSVGLGVNKNPPLSLLVDPTGIYYDASRPSLLENILNGVELNLPALPVFDGLRQLVSEATGDVLDDPALLTRAKHAIQQIIEHKLSKYNASPEVDLGPKQRPRILLIDQTAGDMSIQHGLATADSFQRMLDAALANHPEADILIKIHPDVIAGKKQAHLLHAKQHPQVKLLSDDINPIHLLQQVDEVYVVSSQMGFEALLLGKPVTCFGAPFYAGWGLTTDHIPLQRRSKQRNIEQLFAAAYILYARYLDPDTDEPCEVERVIEHLALQRHWFRENSGHLYCYGFTLWKRGYVRSFLYSPWNQVRFIGSIRQLKKHLPDKDARLVVWGVKDPPELREFARENNIPIWRMEDGFLRSISLGSDFTAPASLVVDKQGIYFDPNQPSDLEIFLQTHKFTEKELQRAQALREALINSRLSKYNIGVDTPLIHQAKPGQRVILVPGQVEDDASIRLGCRDIRTNAQLLKAVREKCPDAYIIYKPHPDVLSGNRKGSKIDYKNTHCDQLVIDKSLPQCLDVADEVHTMTSLVGFEGLMNGKSTTTYGLPFYTGWQLTADYYDVPRRNRNLSIEELVTGTFLYYPRYMNHAKHQFTHPERIIEILKRERAKSGFGQKYKSFWPIRKIRKYRQLIYSVLHGHRNVK